MEKRGRIMAGETLTPMMRQYLRIKSEIAEDVILFFRMGDFYEMFFEDARKAAPVLDITLTRRNGIPMCGVPYHALDAYLARMMRSGCKVAICEQVEDPAEAKGLVRREVTQIVTPGTITEGGLLEQSQYLYLAGVCQVGTSWGIAMVDLSSGHFWGSRVKDQDAALDEIMRYGPAECIVPDSGDKVYTTLVSQLQMAMPGMPVTHAEDWTFGRDASYDLLVRHFGVQSLISFGCEDEPSVICSAGALLYYLQVALRRQTGHIRSFQTRRSDMYLALDETCCANLDLVPIKGRTGGQTLLGILDATCTPMGARMLRDWILRPLAKLDPILARQEAVAAFVADRGLLRSVRDAFEPVRDLARLIARTGNGGGNARDLVAIGRSLEALPAVRALVEGRSGSVLLQSLAEDLRPMPELVDTIANTLVEDAPIGVKDGGMVRDGFSDELDSLRHGAAKGRDWLATYQVQEQERTGIKTLKVRHNKVFGYYIEISKGQLANVPTDYIRKQTLVNAERFITPELKKYENEIMGAHERALALEYEIFVEVRDKVAAETSRIQEAAQALAQLDVLSTLADRALTLDYVRPVIDDSDKLIISKGRHPVVEQADVAVRFVPNDTLLDCRANQLLIITGPNMAGKSTYIRQVAVLVVMAQMGSFVPADAAEIGLVDRVFTRVGANDDLARGRSTFMVEMQETANILHHATSRSLIVLDEIGRGTSTFDGISIAWSVAEYLHNMEHAKARTLFATHYHELTELARTMTGVQNYNILVQEKNETIVFLRRIVPGAADKSYGIQVAKLAGMPDAVVSRATEILANLEEGEIGDEEAPKLARRRGKSVGRDPDNAQLDLFK
ncbi:MAG: DNA mismatch repair protein MutS [Kiritimatiellia bacterium]